MSCNQRPEINMPSVTHECIDYMCTIRTCAMPCKAYIITDDRQNSCFINKSLKCMAVMRGGKKRKREKQKRAREKWLNKWHIMLNEAESNCCLLRKKKKKIASYLMECNNNGKNDTIGKCYLRRGRESYEEEIL